jgi:NhaP-type Na+/H+ or K+/H+ antiporter
MDKKTGILLEAPWNRSLLETEKVAGGETIYAAAIITVFLSVMAHGISAAALADWYGKHMAVLDKRDAADAETTAVPEIHTYADGASPVQVGG